MRQVGYYQEFVVTLLCPHGINQLVFVMEMQFVFCEVMIELLRVHGAGLTGEKSLRKPGFDPGQSI